MSIFAQWSTLVLRFTSRAHVLMLCVIGLATIWLQSHLSVVADDTAASLKTPERFARFPPLEPDQAIESFRVQAGFQMQLIAAEPLVTDPVAMAIDEDGRAYVVEMNDYPYTDPQHHRPWQENPTDAPIGRVRMLADTNRDGIYDSSTLFADGLSWPSGIACYRGGIIVTATPDIWYLKDTDNDGTADVRQRIFTGFRKYNVQAVMNNPIWGLDNHIYVAGSSNGGSVVQPGHTMDKPISARGDFRIQPETSRFELQAGGARFGNTFDDFGNRFLCNIRNPAIHVVIDAKYTARNPYFAAPSLTVDVAAAGDQLPVYRISPVEPWRDLRGRQWSADPTKKLPRSELTGGGVFTSTSGITVYRGAAYPSEFAGQIFLGEVANNVIYRQTVVSDGNTFAANRADAKAEFVASSDTWFRPVNLYNAPDGTLYVLDMYREVIEHPWSIPDDIHAKLDLTSGRDRGRIYRLAPSGFRTQSSDFPKLSQRSVADLVVALGHPSSWWRETAQRLLVQRRERSAVPLLRGLLRTEEPRAAEHALWTLAGMDALEKADMVAALEHPHPRVREHGVRLAERLVAADPSLLQAVTRLADDPDPRLRLQVLLTLGEVVDDEASLKTIARLALRDGHDPWARVAIGCLPVPLSMNLLKYLLSDDTALEATAAPKVVELLADIAGAKADREACECAIAASGRLATSASDPTDARGNAIDELWNGLAQGARRKSKNLHDLLKEVDLVDPTQVASQIDRDFRLAENTNTSVLRRVAATTRLTLASFEIAGPKLLQLLAAHNPQEVQVAAIRGIASYKDASVTNDLISRLPKLTPTVREEILTVILSRPDRALVLLRAIELGKLPAAQLGLSRKSALLASKQPEVRQAAERVLSRTEAARQTIIDRYSAPMQARLPRADLQRGGDVFKQHCANCHRMSGIGSDLGPHMETVRNWDARRLLLNILDPNREVTPQAMSYAIVLGDGRTLAGLITDETAASLTLKRAGVPAEVILRSDIDQLTNTGLSFMPSGFEELISANDMADLIAYIQQPDLP